LRTILPSPNKDSGVVRIDAEELGRFARGVYVNSPVYLSSNRVVRFINWKKLDIVRSLFSSKNIDRVLDFGCGNGVMLPTLSSAFQKVFGIDLHTAAASNMKREYGLGNVFLATADGFRLPFKNNSFCMVVATSALEHFKDLDRAVSEIARVVKPGGSLLFLSPTENLFYRFGRWLFRYKKPEDHYHSAREIQLVLEKYFTSEAVRYFPMRSLPFVAAYQVGRLRKVSQQ
jgi:ubiquinone/menaquinone biosynthesis C-methylase UbiE